MRASQKERTGLGPLFSYSSSMIPPPNTTSPSYNTADCPGVMLFCGSVSNTFILFLESHSILQSASLARYRIFTCMVPKVSIFSFSTKRCTSETVKLLLYNSVSVPNTTLFSFFFNAITYNGSLYEIPSPFLCPMV